LQARSAISIVQINDCNSSEELSESVKSSHLLMHEGLAAESEAIKENGSGEQD
jgi:hypothetical protein